MEWREEGILLSVRRHGEHTAIIDMFTEGHGRHSGVVRGATSRKMTPILQPGAQLDVTWRARLDEHIGSFAVEPVRSRAAAIMGDRLALAGLNSITSLLRFALAEREPHAALYRRSLALLDALAATERWPEFYLNWEVSLLSELGFGLDLSACAVTGATTDLAYISPRTGRAVSREGAGDWADRLLPLAPSLLGQGEGSPVEILAGLEVTGYFLAERVAPALGDRPLPEARQRLCDLLGRGVVAGGR